MTVLPGYLVAHWHDSDAVMSTSRALKLLQGVTTDIVGNCGAGMAPRDRARPPMPGVNVVLGASHEGEWQTFGEYMDAVDRADLAVNVGCFIPHGAVRYFAIGMDRTEPDEAELARMRDAVARGIAAGALRLSTGLIYPPRAFAGTEEISALAEAASEQCGVYMTHMRD